MWANLRLIDACAALDTAQSAVTMTRTYGSIFDTLHHIARAEQSYLGILTGRPPETRLRLDRATNMVEIQEQARCRRGIDRLRGRCCAVGRRLLGRRRG
ncbi:MAG: hypothetical protein H6663_10200 [Candidatus Promineofilum sp.]|nr:hypothetical protein [Promineifilum sp.]